MLLLKSELWLAEAIAVDDEFVDIPTNDSTPITATPAFLNSFFILTPPSAKVLSQCELFHKK